MAHYFENNTEVKSNIKLIKNFINDKEFSFYADNGVFSKKGLDFGTRSLLEKVQNHDIKGDVLDFGCGYGPIGIYIAKTFKTNVDMIDINHRAIELSIKNKELNKVKVNIFESNIYEQINKKYDYIITNPPIRVGKEMLYNILFGAKNHLKKDGSLIFVIHKDQGAKTLMKRLEDAYKVELLGKNKGFYVIICKMP